MYTELPTAQPSNAHSQKGTDNMADSLSIAIGTVLSALEIAETKGGHIEDVSLVSLGGTPTNVIEFTMGSQRYELLVTERPAPKMGHVTVSSRSRKKSTTPSTKDKASSGSANR